MRLTISLALLLTGCVPPVAIKECPAPTVIERVVYVPIDGALTGEVVDDAPGLHTVIDAVAAAKVRKERLAVCNARLEAIRAVQGTRVTPPGS
jgi:hypothetical protein